MTFPIIYLQWYILVRARRWAGPAQEYVRLIKLRKYSNAFIITDCLFLRLLIKVFTFENVRIWDDALDKLTMDTIEIVVTIYNNRRQKHAWVRVVNFLYYFCGFQDVVWNSPIVCLQIVLVDNNWTFYNNNWRQRHAWVSRKVILFLH